MKNIRLSENLVNLRRKRGITQDVIADFLGVTKASVSKWETGLSMPDIAQLPKLASYYDVTIDELMGYEAQLSMEEIKIHYEKFSEAFAKKHFDEVMKEVKDFIRQYYSCCEALVQIVVLLLNHYMFAEESKQSEILEEMIRLCEHIQEKSVDINLCNHTIALQAMIELIRGNPQATIEKLEPYQNPRNVLEGSESILVQAYQMTGQIDEAFEWNQVLMFRHLLCLVENSVFYLMSNLANKEVGLATIERIHKVTEAFNLDKLHPNSFLQFKYASALFYAMQGMDNEAIEELKIFVRDAADFVSKGLYLHGDKYFDRLDNYFKKVDDYLTASRNKDTVLASLNQNLEHPVFDRLMDREEFKELKRSVELWKK